jgi:hypothetical protein
MIYRRGGGGGPRTYRQPTHTITSEGGGGNPVNTDEKCAETFSTVLYTQVAAKERRRDYFKSRLTLNPDGDFRRLAGADAVVGLAEVATRLGAAHPLQPQLGGAAHNLAGAGAVPEDVRPGVGVHLAGQADARPLHQAVQAAAVAHRHTRYVCKKKCYENRFI